MYCNLLQIIENNRQFMEPMIFPDYREEQTFALARDLDAYCPRLLPPPAITVSCAARTSIAASPRHQGLTRRQS